MWLYPHQFEALSSGIADDITLGWLAFPFGFSDSVAICAMCAEVIQMAHQSMETADGSWSGWEPFRSEIFVEDTIFVGSDIGSILVEALEWMEWWRRSLFGATLSTTSGQSWRGLVNTRVGIGL